MQHRKQHRNQHGRQQNRVGNSTRGSGGTGMLRIIGGDWRGRRLTFPSLEGLRPTADRVRETVFNWLAPRIHGARCLDMFAGSGALGLEALSRGAAYCDFLEHQATAALAISEHLNTLAATDRGRVIGGDALRHTRSQAGSAYDIVFIDPPFSDTLTGQALQHLLQADLLAEDARIYLELGRNQALSTLEPNFQILRDKTAGDVHYLLLAPS